MIGRPEAMKELERAEDAVLDNDLRRISPLAQRDSLMMLRLLQIQIIREIRQLIRRCEDDGK